MKQPTPKQFLSIMDYEFKTWCIICMHYKFENYARKNVRRQKTITDLEKVLHFFDFLFICLIFWSLVFRKKVLDTKHHVQN